MGTRMIHLLGGQQRAAARNASTMMCEPGLWDRLRGAASYGTAPYGTVSYRKLFVRNYATIAHICQGFGRVGVAVIAIDTRLNTVAGSVCISARPGQPSVAIVGRHGLADLYLEDDPSLSLRHMAVIVRPPSSWDPNHLVVSLLDLRTKERFHNEHGEQLEGLVAEGPVFVQCGRYALLCLGTGDPGAWPSSAADAWAIIPERHYVEARSAVVEHSARDHMWKPPDAGRSLHRTGVTLVDGPEMAQALLLGGGESVAGYLTVTAGGMSKTIPVGMLALRQGVLIGRNDRCNQHEMLADRRISRVHMMLRLIGDTVYAIDMASTARTFVRTADGLHPVRLVPLHGAGELILGNGRARIAWQPQTA
jgi:hypothetical protein